MDQSIEGRNCIAIALSSIGSYSRAYDVQSDEANADGCSPRVAAHH